MSVWQHATSELTKFTVISDVPNYRSAQHAEPSKLNELTALIAAPIIDVVWRGTVVYKVAVLLKCENFDEVKTVTLFDVYHRTARRISAHAFRACPAIVNLANSLPEGVFHIVLRLNLADIKFRSAAPTVRLTANPKTDGAMPLDKRFPIIVWSLYWNMFACATHQARKWFDQNSSARQF